MERTKITQKLYNKIYRACTTSYTVCFSTIEKTKEYFYKYLLPKRINKTYSYDSKREKLGVDIIEDLLNFIDKYSVTEEEYEEAYGRYLTKASNDRKARWDYMKKKGKPYSKTDNRDRRVGSGGGNKNMVRIPSKKHKNRWKNFVKLFPKYQEMYNKLFKNG